VQEQYSYDKHHQQAANIYRITTDLTVGGDRHNNATSSPPIAPAMKNDFAEVADYTRIIPTISVKQHLLLYKDKSLYEKDAVFVDSAFFKVFTYHFISGSPSNAVSDPYSIVLMKSTAEKLFGAEDPVGKSIEIDNSYGKHAFKITGVIDERLGKTHIHANLFMSINSGGIGSYAATSNAWAGNNFVSSYVKLNPNTDAAALDKKLPAFLEKYGHDQLKDGGMKKELHLQPITAIHTSSGYRMYQFYEFINCTCIKKSERSWCKKSHRRGQMGSYQTVPQRIDAVIARECIDRIAAVISGIALSQSHYRIGCNLIHFQRL
jgi:putative ABC transport system permease protein